MRLFALILMLMISGPALAFKPFTPVKDVCPDCPSKSDVLTLNDGSKLKGQIIGENTVFYVMFRHHEVRAIPKNQVQTVEFSGGTKPANLGNQDQILLKNGHVLNGKITADKEKPPLFQLKSSHGNQTFIVFKSEIAQVFKNGLEATF